MNKMIEVKFDFQVTQFDGLLLVLLGLPESLRPTHFNIGEDEPRVSLTGLPKIPTVLQGQTLGYFLYGPGLIYDITPGAEGASLTCDLELPLGLVEELMIRLAVFRPLYGYAAAPEERLARNRVYHQLGINKIEAWVGRDPRKWLPGLYWLNLISEEMAARHKIPLDLLASARGNIGIWAMACTFSASTTGPKIGRIRRFLLGSSSCFRGCSISRSLRSDCPWLRISSN